MVNSLEEKPPRDGTKISTGYRKAVVHCDWAVGFLFNLFTAQVRQTKKKKKKSVWILSGLVGSGLYLLCRE